MESTKCLYKTYERISLSLELDQKLQDLMTETNHVQLSYRITDEELKAQDKVRKKLQDATKQIHVIVVGMTISDLEAASQAICPGN